MRAELGAWPGWVDALGGALLAFCWQGAIILLVYAALRSVIGPRPLLRLWTGHVALLALAAAPLATLWHSWPRAGAAEGHAALAERPALALFEAGGVVGAWAPWLVAAWAVGVLLLGGRAAAQWWRLWQVCRQAVPLPEPWQQRLQQLQRRFSVRQPVRLLETARVAGPVLFGLLRPVVLLPAGLVLRLPPRQLELLLAHELAHLRRWDHLANLLQIALETALFYHPAVHWISRRVREDREQCCDDLVASVCGQPIDYARALLAVAEQRAMQPPLLLAASGGLLLQRVERIVGRPERRPGAGRWLPLLLGLGAALLGLHALRSADAVLPPAAEINLRPSLLELPSPLLGLAISDWTPRRIALQPGLPEVPAASDIADATVPVVEPATLPPPALDRPAVETPSPAEILTAPVIDPPSAAPLPALPPASVPQPLHRQAPVYPQDARWRGVEGSVELDFLVAADGRVGEIRVHQEHPAGVFAAAAQAALRKWRFPAGAASATWHRQAFDFRLGGDTAGKGSRHDCQEITGTRLCRGSR